MALCLPPAPLPVLSQGQVLPASEVAKRPVLSSAKRSKTATLVVMFFGEYTFSWLPESAVMSWAEGVQRKFHVKSVKKLQTGVREAAAFLSDGQRSAPSAWWTQPPAHLPGSPAKAPAAAATVAIAAPEVAAPSLPPEPFNGPQPAALEVPPGAVAAAEAPLATAAAALVASLGPPVAAPALAARTARAPAPISRYDDCYAADGPVSPRSGKIRWSARDILKPFVNRLKQLFPALAADPMPASTDDLFAYIRERFGAAIDIDKPFKGKTAYDLVADLFSAVSGRTITTEQVNAVFCLHVSPLAPRVDDSALAALNLNPKGWHIPLRAEDVKNPGAAAPCPVLRPPAAHANKPVSPRAPRPQVAPAAPAVRAVSAPARGPVAPAVAAPAYYPVAAAVPGGPVLDVINGRLVPRARSRSGASLDATASGEDSASAFTQPPIVDAEELARRNRPPSYMHIRQNVWISRPRPK